MGRRRLTARKPMRAATAVRRRRDPSATAGARRRACRPRRRFNGRMSRLPVLTLAAVLTGAALGGCAADAGDGPTAGAAQVGPREPARVTRVVDGDTLKVRLADGRRKTVRVLGIDTPETKKPGTPVECGGPQATAAMERLALQGGGYAAKGRDVVLVGRPQRRPGGSLRPDPGVRRRGRPRPRRAADRSGLVARVRLPRPELRSAARATSGSRTARGRRAAGRGAAAAGLPLLALSARSGRVRRPAVRREGPCARPAGAARCAPRPPRSPHRSRRRGRARARPGRSPRRARRSSSCSWVNAGHRPARAREAPPGRRPRRRRRALPSVRRRRRGGRSSGGPSTSGVKRTPSRRPSR